MRRNGAERLTRSWGYLPPNTGLAAVQPWWSQSGNEWVDGNYGLMLLDGRPRATLNIGGGRDNTFLVDAPGGALATERWHHLALSHDGAVLRLYVDGRPAGERSVGRRRTAGRGGLAFGRRPDNSGDGYYFRGVIDEVRLSTGGSRRAGSSPGRDGRRSRWPRSSRSAPGRSIPPVRPPQPGRSSLGGRPAWRCR